VTSWTEIVDRAAAANRQWCTGHVPSDAETLADGYREISEAWARIHRYEPAEEHPELLYWRGVLATCLGQDEMARLDLSTYMERVAGGPTDSRRKDARRRLRRLGGAVPVVTAGPVAAVETPEAPETEPPISAGITSRAYNLGAAGIAEVELAVAANEALQTHCADLYSDHFTLVAGGYHEVSSAWSALHVVDAEAGDVSLLYWRGVLAACLGQDELAIVDLDRFERACEGEQAEALAGLLTDARARSDRIRALQSTGGKARAGRRGPRQSLRSHARDAGSWTVGLATSVAHGPYFAASHDVSLAGSESVFATESLVGSWAPRFGIEAEVHVARPLLLGVHVGTAIGSRQVTGLAAPELAGLVDPVIEDRLAREHRPWLDMDFWLGVMPWPGRPITPVARLVIGHRYLAPVEDEGTALGRAWAQPGVGGAAGIVITLGGRLDLELAAWWFGELSRGERTWDHGSVESSEVAEALVLDPAAVVFAPTLAARLAI